MKQIGSLFEKYKKTLRPPQSSVEKEVVAVIVDITNLPIKPEQVTYQPGTKNVQLNMPSVLKTEILKQQPLILSELQRCLGEYSAPTRIG